jgi:hypothetical protein
MELTAEQYRRLMGLGESPKEEDLIFALYGKPKGKMTLKEIDALDFSEFKMPEGPINPDFFVHEGVLYGRQNMTELTFGLYVDLMEQAKDINKNLIALISMLWRPVTKISFWNRTKAYIASKLLLSKWGRMRVWGFKMLADVNYTIEDYDPMVCTKREKSLESAPGSVAAYTTNFFLTTSEVLLLNSLRSLKDQLENQQKDLVESLQKISAGGDGSPTSGPLQEKEQ